MDRFQSITVVDAEYNQLAGEVPEVHCFVSRDLESGRKAVWTSQTGGPPPYPSGPHDLVVAFSAQAEAGCMLELGWPIPHHFLDLYVVFARLRNNHGHNAPASLLSALDFFQIPHLPRAAKDFYRALATNGGPLSPEQMLELVRYCESDVDGTTKLFEAIKPRINWPHDLLASRYTGGPVAVMERAGVPVDAGLIRRITRSLSAIRSELKRAVNAVTPVYGPSGEFSLRRLEAILLENQIPWPRTERGTLKTDEETLKLGAFRFPELALALETQILLVKIRKFNLAIGQDGRNRTSLRPFASKTGRNQPSSSRSIFGLGAWLRHVICPPQGHELVCLDYEQQEFLIGGALSGDQRMLDAYRTGDPYMALAQSSGALDSVTEGADRKKVRDRYKTAMLGIQYGISAAGLGPRVGGSAVAEKLIRDHRDAFPHFWAWTRSVQQHVSLHKADLVSPFGWSISCHSVGNLNPRSVANFPIQAAGADIMRIACIAMVERGIPLVWTMHDGFLLVCPEGEGDQVVKESVRLLEESSAVVLRGNTCRVGVRRFDVGQPYQDEKGRFMFEKIMVYVEEIEGRENA